MKRVPVILSVVAVVLASLAIYLSTSSSELVYVDVNKLIEGYKKTKNVKAEFDKKASVMKSNVDTLITSWQKELQKYEKDRVSMTPNELKLRQELLSNKQQQISEYRDAIQKQIEEEDKKVTQTVINDINSYIKEYGKNNNYKIIFGASGGGNIMFADENCDLTSKVLDGLNAQYESKK